MDIIISTTRPFSAETMSGIDLSWAKFEILLKNFGNINPTDVKEWSKKNLEGKNRFSTFGAGRIQIIILYIELETDMVLFKLRFS